MRRTIVIIAVVLSLVIVLNLPAVRDLSTVKSLRLITLSVFYPFQAVYHFMVDGTTGFFSSFWELRSAQIKNVELTRKLSESLANNQVMNELIAENQRLRASLGFRESNLYQYRLLAAEVIARSPGTWFEAVQINRGKNEGVREDMAVISSDGVVGRVTEVAARTSKVQLLIDPDFAVSGLDQDTGEIGIVSGRAMLPLQMRYVLATAKVKVGDSIVTSHLSENFPRGFPIGVVSKIEKNDYDIFQKIDVHPRVNFGRLKEVFVIMGSHAKKFSSTTEAHALP